MYFTVTVIVLCWCSAFLCVAAASACRAKWNQKVEHWGFWSSRGSYPSTFPRFRTKVFVNFFVVSIMDTVSVEGQSPTFRDMHILGVFLFVYIYIFIYIIDLVLRQIGTQLWKERGWWYANTRKEVLSKLCSVKAKNNWNPLVPGFKDDYFDKILLVDFSRTSKIWGVDSHTHPREQDIFEKTLGRSDTSSRWNSRCWWRWSRLNGIKVHGSSSWTKSCNLMYELYTFECLISCFRRGKLF